VTFGDDQGVAGGNGIAVVDGQGVRIFQYDSGIV
jgi:hypothetical protein